MKCILFFSEGDGVHMQTDQASDPKSAQNNKSRFPTKSSAQGGLTSVTRLIKLGRCKNVVVVAGAGISTASGIPDFRLVLTAQMFSPLFYL